LTVEHNILLWLDEKSKRHRRMLWKKVFRVIEAYLIRDGIANTMWCLSQRRDEKPCSGGHDATWVKYFMPWTPVSEV
jgi:hypothetical protein